MYSSDKKFHCNGKGRPGNEITVEPKISANRREINQYFFVGGHFSIFSGFTVRANDLGLQKTGGRLPDCKMKVHAASFVARAHAMTSDVS